MNFGNKYLNTQKYGQKFNKSVKFGNKHLV